MYIFFFKQKTAYEMRISDWSSDVCSSDLGRNQGTGPHWHIEIEGPTGNRQAGAGSAAGKMNVQSSQVQGPSGSVNTGVSNQSQRTMTAGPAIEWKQQNVESKVANAGAVLDDLRSEEHTSELQSLKRTSYAVFCLKKKKITTK